MNTKKSKFQERLEAAVKKRLPEDLRGSINDEVKLHDNTFISGAVSEVSQKRTSQTAQPPNFLSLQRWVDVKTEKPPYYSPINIWCGDPKEVLFNWSRVFNGEKDYYVNDVNDRVIYKISHWSAPAGIIYPKYNPMTAKDLPGYELTQLIKLMEKRKTYYAQIFIDPTQYIQGIDDCVKILERRLKKVSKSNCTLSNTGT